MARARAELSNLCKDQKQWVSFQKCWCHWLARLTTWASRRLLTTTPVIYITATNDDQIETSSFSSTTMSSKTAVDSETQCAPGSSMSGVPLGNKHNNSGFASHLFSFFKFSELENKHVRQTCHASEVWLARLQVNLIFELRSFVQQQVCCPVQNILVVPQCPSDKLTAPHKAWQQNCIFCGFI